MQPGTEPRVSGTAIFQFEPVDQNVGYRCRKHQRHGLYQVRADELECRQGGVEHEQGDHDERTGPDRGDTDQESAQRAN